MCANIRILAIHRSAEIALGLPHATAQSAIAQTRDSHMTFGTRSFDNGKLSDIAEQEMQTTITA